MEHVFIGVTYQHAGLACKHTNGDPMRDGSPRYKLRRTRVELLTLINLSMTICLIIGSVVAYRYGFARTANEVQERVIHALQSEIQTMHERIAALEHENTRLNYTITTICTSLKQRGVHVTIDGDIISIHGHFDEGYSYSTRIQGDKEAVPVPVPAESTDEQQTRLSTPKLRSRRRQV